MHQPIPSLFSSQSNKRETNVPDYAYDDDDNVMVSFAEIQFHPEEDNIPNHMLMSGKQFKILNNKLNSLLQIQADTGGRHSKWTYNNIQHEITKFRDVAKEHHILFVEEVQKSSWKVYVVVETIKKLAEYNNSFTTKVDVKNEFDSKVLLKLDEVLGNLKESMSKLDLSQQSTISMESISKMISSLEKSLKINLALILQLMSFLPTNCPPVK
ncbi:unnamed protein product [Lactuca saligna]|uniref:Uncharacterized protein n=1 Tax=Lactuca saligna TaxID=75948 RepID=A0AA35ZZX0_LACSI|nr:unnamed protein product [Lactuca saligna]